MVINGSQRLVLGQLAIDCSGVKVWTAVQCVDCDSQRRITSLYAELEALTQMRTCLNSNSYWH
jgi:hypothetical protein